MRGFCNVWVCVWVLYVWVGVYWFCDVWVCMYGCVCVGFVMCGCVCIGFVMCGCVYGFCDVCVYVLVL